MPETDLKWVVYGAFALVMAGSVYVASTSVLKLTRDDCTTITTVDNRNGDSTSVKTCS